MGNLYMKLKRSIRILALRGSTVAKRKRHLKRLTCASGPDCLINQSNRTIQFISTARGALRGAEKSYNIVFNFLGILNISEISFFVKSPDLCQTHKLGTKHEIKTDQNLTRYLIG